MSEWTDELKTDVVEKYKKANPTPANSTEIIDEIASEIDKTPNGVRMILIKAGVYVKKEADKKGTNGSATTTSKRVNKADSINDLSSLISSQGLTPDDEILGKLTGKAAVYFSGVIQEIIDKG